MNVGPERAQAARQLADYLNRNGDGGGYHKVIDDATSIQLASFRELVFGARGCDGYANERGIHYCLIGYADQSVEEWDDAYSRGALAILAQELAHDADMIGIPTYHARGSLSGQCGHHDVTLNCNVNGGHYDPGPHFPWPKLLELVTYFRAAPVAPVLPSGDAVSLRVADTSRPGTPAGRTRFAQLIPGHGVLLVNGARCVGDSGPTPFGTWLVLGELAKERAVELVATPGGFVVALNDNGTIGPVAFKEK